TPVRGPQNLRYPITLRVKGGAPRTRRDVFRVALTQARVHLIASAGAPAHIARVGEKDHGPHHPVSEGTAVAVAVVGPRDTDAVLIGEVVNERDRRSIRTERRAREAQPARRRLESLTDAITPTQSVTAVVHLVENHQSAVRL